MEVLVRQAVYGDREAAVCAEIKAVRGLRYLDDVWDQFYNDQSGELLVGEIDGKVVAVGKYTLLPDSSAWLETLRVDPEFQGRGIGKAFYRRFLERAAMQEVSVLGMYTTTNNAVSKGLAERFGFSLSATYRGASLKVANSSADTARFIPLSPSEAVLKLMPVIDIWDNHVVLNRTFYPATADNFAAMAREGKVLYNPSSGSLCILGYRFLRERDLHLAFLQGDIDEVIAFALKEACLRGHQGLSIMFPPKLTAIENYLAEKGFAIDPTDCIVMTKRM